MMPGNKVEVDLPTSVDHMSRAPGYEERAGFDDDLPLPKGNVHFLPVTPCRGLNAGQLHRSCTYSILLK